MSFVIRFEGMAGTITNPVDFVTVGNYLTAFDADAADGLGAAEWSSDPEKALKFETFEAGWELWRSQSTKQPLRADGRPNRPLTAVNITIERA